MSRDIIHSILLAASFLALFGLAELLYHKLKVKAELTRKLVHLGTGVLTLLFPLMLSSHWYVLFLCAGFAAILLLSLRFGFLQSINAIDRDSWGSLCYPVAVYLTFLFYAQFFHAHHLIDFYLPILVLAVCDPVAALVGKRFPAKKFSRAKNSKTLAGCLGFFISCCLLTLLLLVCFNSLNSIHTKTLVFVCILSASATFTEAISGKGIDNLTIPISVMFILFLGYGL